MPSERAAELRREAAACRAMAAKANRLALTFSGDDRRRLLEFVEELERQAMGLENEAVALAKHP